MSAVITAVVTDIRGTGNKRYAVTKLEPPVPKIANEKESITFSIGNAWSDQSHDPKVGQYVFLDGIRQFTKGLRALSATPTCI